MDLFEFFRQVFVLFIININPIVFFLLLLISLVIYHILLFLIRDLNYVRNLKRFEDPDKIDLKDLIETPLVTIVIPAWKEGEIFRSCLLNITKLQYPNLKVIINIGGGEQTMKIANSFKKFENFTIIYQKQGSGKIKAINDCLNYISNGIACILDADILLTDEILLDMLYPLINGKEDIVIAPIAPHSSILNRDIVKYLFINRYSNYKQKFTRYTYGFASNACIKNQVINSLGKFSEKRMLDDGRATGMDLSSKGYKSFKLIDSEIQSLTFPISMNKFFHQNIKWIENSLFYSIKNKKIRLIKFASLAIISLYIIITPLFISFNIYFFLIGIIFFSSMYLKRIRKLTFFKLVNKNDLIKFNIIFFIKLIYFTYLDIIVNVIVCFEIFFYRKAYKKRKNLLI